MKVGRSQGRRGAAAATEEDGEASASRKKIRVTPPPPLSPSPVAFSIPSYLTDSEDDLGKTRGHGGDGGAAAAAAMEVEEDEEGEIQSDGEHSEYDGDDVDGEEFAEEESQSDGGHSASDGDDVDGDEFVEEEAAAALGSAGVNEEGSPEPASAGPSSPYARAGGAMVEDVTVADADALECGVCFLPLRSPIFQCELSHVVYSACRDKLERTTRGYRWCHAMEHLVESIRIPCPHAAHGCGARPAYHNRGAHGRTCPHAPCRCPGTSCGLVGSMAALLDHFATAHGWPCTAKVRAGKSFSVRLHDGFNFLRADRAAGDPGATSSIPCLFMPVPAERDAGTAWPCHLGAPRASSRRRHYLQHHRWC